MGRHSLTLEISFFVCTFYCVFRNTKTPSQTWTVTRLVSTLEAKCSNFLILPLCVCGCARVYDCKASCVSCIILFHFHSENATRVLKKITGFVVATLMKVKSLSRREQSVRAHKYSCGHATDGCFSIEPQFETERSSRPETFRAPPNGRFPLPPRRWPWASVRAESWGVSPQRAMLANSEL